MTYDPHASAEAVTEIVDDAADRDHALELRIADLERQLADAHEHAALAPSNGHVVTSFDELDEGELAALVGEETAKVLAAARNAAAGIVSNAERTAAQMRGKADRDADGVAADADALLERAAREADGEAARRLAEADTAIGLAIAEAEHQALALRSDAEAAVADVQALAQRRIEDASAEAMRITDEARADAKALVEQAGLEGRSLVAEAQEVRARMLEDLLRRRKLLRRQVEQLHAGRERLAQAFGVVHDAMRSIDSELSGVLAEAKAAAEQAAAHADSTSDPVTDELEVMVIESRAAAGLDVPPDETGDPSDTDEVSEPAETVDGDAAVPEAAMQDAGADGGEDSDAASSLFTRLKADPSLEVPVVDAEVAELPPPPEPQPEPQAAPEAPATIDVSSTLREPAVTLIAAPVVEDPVPEARDEPVAVTDAITVQRDGLLDELSRSVVRKLKRQLSDEQNEVLDTIRRQRPLPALDELLAPEPEHIRRYAELALPALRNAALAGTELPAALHADRPGGPGAAVKTARRQGAAAGAQATASSTTSPKGDLSVRDLAAVLAVDVVGALRAKLETCMTGTSAETLRLAATGPKSSGTTTTKATRSAAADQLCDEVRLAYREVRNRNVDQAAADIVGQAFARGIRTAPDGPPDALVAELLSGLPAR